MMITAFRNTSSGPILMKIPVDQPERRGKRALRIRVYAMHHPDYRQMRFRALVHPNPNV